MDSIILYQQNLDGSFKYREVSHEELDDYEDILDGRLYYKGDEDDLWHDLYIDNMDTDSVSDLYDSSDDYVKAFTAYRLGDCNIFAKAKKYDKISESNSKAGKASASKFSAKERSERAKKAVQARWNKNQ